jgi:DNA-binding transcriptional LysR family regulator
VALLPSAFVRPRVADRPGLALVRVVDGPHQGGYLVWSRFDPGPATRALLDVMGIRPKVLRGMDAHPDLN